MADNIAQWLEGLGLGQYAKAFAENGIDFDTLLHLRDEDFERLGVLLGHMRKLQISIATLSANESSIQPEGSRTLDREPQPTEAEHRQLTVMFCDMVGSTALSTQLEPEDYREVIRAYQETCAGVIKQFDGYVAKYMGDGILAYFGWPRGHEDDAERAINAGLGIVKAVAALTPPVGDIQAMAVRIGPGRGRRHRR